MTPIDLFDPTSSASPSDRQHPTPVSSDASADDVVITHVALDHARGRLPLVVAGVLLIGMMFVVVAGGPDADVATPAATALDPVVPSTAPEAAGPNTTVLDTTARETAALDTTALDTTALEPALAADDAPVAGQLVSGRRFEVEEVSPGVLCTNFTEPSERICHLETIDASGPAVVDGLIFGYLSPGSDTARVRYRRSSNAAAVAIVNERDRYFAVAVTADDAYRLQYLSNDDVIRETALRPPSGAPSQTVEEAARDGVDPAVAALPVIRRMSVIAEVTEPEEGPYVVSTHLDDGMPSFEVLLLDETGTLVRRAHPFSRWQPDDLVVTPDAVFFLATAANQHPVIARLDRASGERIVRVLPNPAIGQPPEAEFEWWTIGEPLKTGVTLDALRWLGDGTVSVGYDGSRAFFDATSLDVVITPGN